MTAIEHEVRSVIGEKLGLQAEEIDADASLVADLGADSLDTVEMVIALEDKFDLDISDEDAQGVSTLHQAVEYITRSLEARSCNPRC